MPSIPHAGDSPCFRSVYQSLLDTDRNTYNGIDIALNTLNTCIDALSAITLPLGVELPLASDTVTIDPFSSLSDSHKSQAADLQQYTGASPSIVTRIINAERDSLAIFDDPFQYILSCYYSERRAFLHTLSLLLTINADETHVFNSQAQQILAKIDLSYSTVLSIIKSLSYRASMCIDIDPDNSYSALSASQHLLEQHGLLEILCLILTNAELQPNEHTRPSVIQWFQYLRDTAYLTTLSPPESLSRQVVNNPLHGRAFAISYLLLDFPQSETLHMSFPDQYCYLKSAKDFEDIHRIIAENLSEYADASPLILLWSIICHRMETALDEYSPKDFSNSNFILPPNGSSLAQTLIQHALSADVFGFISAIASETQISPQVRPILASAVNASLVYVALADNVVRCLQNILDGDESLHSQFVASDASSTALFLMKSKFPYIYSPFVKLASSLGSRAWPILRSMETFLHQLPEKFSDYEFSQEDSSIIVSLSEICVISPRQEDGLGGVYLPAKLQGRILPGQATPPFVLWDFPFNGWEYIGRYLEFMYDTGTQNEEAAAATVSLISNTLKSLDSPDANELLSMVSTLLLSGDIIDLMSNISVEAFQTKSPELSTACIVFFDALCGIRPNRVWSFLCRPSAYERRSVGGIISLMTSAVQGVNGSYSLSRAIFEFYCSLIDVAARSLLSDIEVTLCSDVLAKFTNHILTSSVSLAYWKWDHTEHRLMLSTMINDCLLKILYRALDIGVPCTETKANKIFFQSAKLVCDNFLSPAEVSSRPLAPWIDRIKKAGTICDALITGNRHETLNIQLVISCHNLLIGLIKARSTLNLEPSLLEKELYSAAPNIVENLILKDHLKSHSLGLLNALISTKWPGVPFSLLAYLGANHTKALITKLSATVESDSEALSDAIAATEFLSNVVSHRQEGLTIVLLSGKNIMSSDQPEQHVSLFRAIESKALSGDQISPFLSKTLFKGIFLARNNWAALISTEAQRKNFLESAMSKITDGCDLKLKDFDTISTLINPSDVLECAAHCMRVCALEVFKASKKPSDISSKSIIDILQSRGIVKLSEAALRINGYRASLHGNLIKNFQHKWRGFQLDLFRVSDMKQREYGQNFIYNIEWMEMPFSVDPYWPEYRKEIEEANLNLSRVESQIDLAESWIVLISALTEYTKITSTNSPDMVAIAMLCLKVNVEEGIAAIAFQGIYEKRLQLAFSIIQKLLDKKLITDTDALSFIDLIWQAMSSSDVDFLTSLNDNSKLNICRSLLRLTIACLQPLEHAKPVTQLATIESIFGLVVAKGFYEVALLSQDQSMSHITLESIILLTAVARRILSVNGISAADSQLASHIMEADTLNAAMFLYSYSDQLKVSEEPIYAELSCSFLAEISRVVFIAEQLVMYGVYSVLMESKISLRIQQGSIRIPQEARLHSFWTRGVLHLSLLLLSKIGNRTIIETQTLLEYFREQVVSSFQAWGNPQTITLSMTEELVQLATLFELLKGMCIEYDIPSSPIEEVYNNNKLPMKESIDYLLSHPKYLLSCTVISSTDEQQMVQKAKDKGTSELAALLMKNLTLAREILSH
ncbi:hypothetical protein CANCADRAFT_42155 [Tortispora caseinolytica NRRL Y-17796]|uniref:Uncharacterized protein n=1 Tax=Tortispora caseinolytica NRRL Y-17796 TaxID=767744 RepID=A0A1E4TIK1_9ASCO|nr:hypothetical protein CANCADRAFT_42155 [Tortispora caseinolytica NRRL Y-17796]